MKLLIYSYNLGKNYLFYIYFTTIKKLLDNYIYKLFITINLRVNY